MGNIQYFQELYYNYLFLSLFGLTNGGATHQGKKIYVFLTSMSWHSVLLLYSVPQDVLYGRKSVPPDVLYGRKSLKNFSQMVTFFTVKIFSIFHKKRKTILIF